MSKSSKSGDNFHPPLSERVFDAIKYYEHQTITELAASKVRDLKGTCSAMSLLVFESNVNSSHSEASDDVGHFFSILEKELHLLEILIEYGLTDIKGAKEGGLTNATP